MHLTTYHGWRKESLISAEIDGLFRQESTAHDSLQSRRAGSRAKPANNEIDFCQSERFLETRPLENGNGLSLRRTSVWSLLLLPHS